MKREPLKNKVWNEKYHTPKVKTNLYFKKEDVKSAVEWLKELIRKEDLSLRVDIFTAVDKAFEDVTK